MLTTNKPDGNQNCGKFHVLVHNLAWIVLVAHGFLFPLASVWYIQGVLKKYIESSATYASELDNDENIKNLSLCKDKKIWTYFFASKFKPSKFWFRQIKLLMVFLSAVCNEIFAIRRVYWYAIVYLSMLIVHSILLFYVRPYSKDHQWKLYVSIYSHICTAFYVLMNFCSSKAAFNGALRVNLAWLAPLTMSLTMFLFVLLLYAYFSTLFKGAAKEEQEVVLKQEFISSRTVNISSEMSSVMNALHETDKEEKKRASVRPFPLKKNIIQAVKTYVEMKVFKQRRSKYNDQVEGFKQQNDEMFSYGLIHDEPSN